MEKSRIESLLLSIFLTLDLARGWSRSLEVFSITKWFGLEKTSKIISFHPLCHGQGQLLDQVAPNSIQLGLEHFQGWGRVNPFQHAHPTPPSREQGGVRVCSFTAGDGDRAGNGPFVHCISNGFLSGRRSISTSHSLSPPAAHPTAFPHPFCMEKLRHRADPWLSHSSRVGISPFLPPAMSTHTSSCSSRVRPPQSSPSHVT